MGNADCPIEGSSIGDKIIATISLGAASITLGSHFGFLAVSEKTAIVPEAEIPILTFVLIFVGLYFGYKVLIMPRVKG